MDTNQIDLNKGKDEDKDHSNDDKKEDFKGIANEKKQQS